MIIPVILNAIILIAVLGVGGYIAYLLIKALKIYIKKNSDTETEK